MTRRQLITSCILGALCASTSFAGVIISASSEQAVVSGGPQTVDVTFSVESDVDLVGLGYGFQLSPASATTIANCAQCTQPGGTGLTADPFGDDLPGGTNVVGSEVISPGFWDSVSSASSPAFPPDAGFFQMTGVGPATGVGVSENVFFARITIPSANAGDAWEVDLVAGAAASSFTTADAPGVTNIDFMGINDGLIYVVPEPAGLALSFFGILGLLAIRRR